MYSAGGFIRVWHEFYENYFFDIINKTDTHTRIGLEEYDKKTPNIKSAYAYIPSYTKTIKRSIKKIVKKDSSVLKYNFLDIGCGKGKILLVAFQAGFKKGIGFEINKSLSNIAKKNILNKRINKNYKIINKNAVNKSILPKFSVCYFYNPFNKFMSIKFFKIIEKKKFNNKKYLIYVNPLYSFLLKKNWKLIEQFEIGTQDVQILRCKI